MSISRRDTQVSPRRCLFFRTRPSTLSSQPTRCSRAPAAATRSHGPSDPEYQWLLCGHGARQRTAGRSLFANLNTKIFHANGDQANQQVGGRGDRSRARADGKFEGTTRQEVGGFSDALGIGNVQTSAGISEIYEFEIQPSFFVAGLKTGGPDTGVWWKQSSFAAECVSGPQAARICFVHSRKSDRENGIA